MAAIAEITTGQDALDHLFGLTATNPYQGARRLLRITSRVDSRRGMVMTNTGCQPQQAVQQATQQAVQQDPIRDSVENAAQERWAAEMGMRSGQHFSAYGRRSPVRTGIGLMERLVGFVVSLVGISLSIGILFGVLNRVHPDWFHCVLSWGNSLL